MLRNCARSWVSWTPPERSGTASASRTLMTALLLLQVFVADLCMDMEPLLAPRLCCGRLQIPQRCQSTNLLTGTHASHAGISGLTDTEHTESFQEMNNQQPSEREREQEQHHGENGMPLSAAPQQAVKQDLLLQPKAEPVQPPQPINLYPNFPMPPEMHMGMSSTSPAADPWQSEEQQDGGFMPRGRQLRQRPQQRAKGRKREHSPGWSPIGVHVQKRLR